MAMLGTFAAVAARWLLQGVFWALSLMDGRDRPKLVRKFECEIQDLMESWRDSICRSEAVAWLSTGLVVVLNLGLEVTLTESLKGARWTESAYLRAAEPGEAKYLDLSDDLRGR